MSVYNITMPNKSSKTMHITCTHEPPLTPSDCQYISSNLVTLFPALTFSTVMELKNNRPHLHAGIEWITPQYSQTVSLHIKKFYEQLGLQVTRSSIRISYPPDMYQIYAGYHTKESDAVPLNSQGLDPQLMEEASLQYKKSKSRQVNRREKRSKKEEFVSEFAQYVHSSPRPPPEHYGDLVEELVAFMEEHDTQFPLQNRSQLLSVLASAASKLKVKRSIQIVLIQKLLGDA